MRHALLFLASIAGCGGIGETTVSYDPETGEAKLHRSMLAGPVDTGLEIVRPDGTTVSFWWRSDVDLSSAEAVALAREKNIGELLQKIPTAVPGVVP